MRRFFYPTPTGRVESLELLTAGRKADVEFIPTVPFNPFTGALPLADNVDGIFCDHPALAVRCAIAGCDVAVYDSTAEVFYTYRQVGPDAWDVRRDDGPREEA